MEATASGTRMAANVALVLVWLCVLLPRAASGQVVVPDAPTCSSCKLSIRVLATIGDLDGPGSLPGLPGSIAVDGRGNYWVSFSSSLPMVFDSAGRFIREVGRKGQGPGEFNYPGVITALPGDSVLVADVGTQRATVIAPDFRAVRSMPLPPGQIFAVAPFRWPTDLVLNGFIQTKENFGWPLHRATISGARPTVVKSFGTNGGTLRPGEEPELQQKLTAVRQGRLWVADVLRYRMTQWTVDGEQVMSLERRPPWFQGASPWDVGSRNRPPPPRISDIGEDDAGRLWAFTLVAGPTWRDAWTALPAAGEHSTSRIAWEHLFRTTIEVIDPRAGRVIARGSFDAAILAALPGNRAAAYSVTSAGVPQISILSIQIQIP